MAAPHFRAAFDEVALAVLSNKPSHVSATAAGSAQFETLPRGRRT